MLIDDPLPPTAMAVDFSGPSTVVHAQQARPILLSTLHRVFDDSDKSDEGDEYAKRGRWSRSAGLGSVLRKADLEDPTSLSYFFPSLPNHAAETTNISKPIPR